jgi:DNA-binding response OmpR family regulator
MMPGAIILLVARLSPTRERLSHALRAVGYQTVLVGTIAEARASLAARKIAPAGAQLDPTSGLALAFARNISPGASLVALLDQPVTMKCFITSAIWFDKVIFLPFTDAEVAARINAVLARRRANNVSSALHNFTIALVRARTTRRTVVRMEKQ